ncbi:MAG: helix-turn-helix transcriptional regulator [Acidimicrobiales bacterium]
MVGGEAHPRVPADTRGILRPDAMLRVVRFDRQAPGEVLEGLVEWFWTVEWSLPPGVAHDQDVLSHPAGNISIGTVDDEDVPLDPPEGRVWGVQSGLSHRHLVLDGWTVAARTAVGGLGALIGRPARSLTDARCPLDELAGLDAAATLTAVAARPTNGERVACLRDGLSEMVERRDPALVEEARRVVEVARQAETDRAIRRTEQLAAAAGVSVRSLQRLFDVHVGVSPAFVIRRCRLIDAAEAARAAVDGDGTWAGWAAVAAELGYADQAHLSRDFTQHVGVSPAAYVAQCAVQA